MGNNTGCAILLVCGIILVIILVIATNDGASNLDTVSTTVKVSPDAVKMFLNVMDLGGK